MIAQLAMYDRPETRAANDRLWAAIRAELGFGPERLDRSRDVWEAWQSPDLALAQTCGYPFRTRLAGKVALVGTPDHGLEGCPPGHYRSVFVARRDDPRGDVSEFEGATFAYNEALSQSGWAAPRCHAERIGLGFGGLLESGGHRLSARAVAEGRADFAALDALSWQMISRWDDWAEGLKPVGMTTPTPALPYITAKGRNAEAIHAAMASAIAALSAEDRHTLGLRGILRIPERAYLAVPNPPAP